VVKFLDAKEAAAFEKRSDEVSDCMQRTLEKLDPSGRARHYDVVSSSGGKIIKVRSPDRSVGARRGDEVQGPRL